MGTSRVNCEIVEVKDEHSTLRQPQTVRQVIRTQERDQKPPILKKAHNKGLEDDINKLFESVNLRSSKSLDLSDSWRNASKKPMRSNGSHSPGIGFSEPVSLKQALRGLCISQAAEMAAMKRLSMPSASPRVSEAGKNINLNRSPLIEESTSYSNKKLATQSACSSPIYSLKPSIKRVECKSSESVEGKNTLSASNLPRQEPKTKSANQGASDLVIKDTGSAHVCNDIIVNASEVDEQLLETVYSKQEEKHNTPSALPHRNSYGDMSMPDKKIYDSATPVIGPNKGTPKLRRKSKLQTSSSSAVKIRKDVKPTRSTSRTVKPVIRNKNLVIKKPKKLPASTDGNMKSSGQLVCQRCQCSLTDSSKASSQDHPKTEAFTGSNSINCGSNKIDSVATVWDNNNDTRVVKSNMNLKSTEKGDISQSSKSSICDFSSSTTTSLSEDSSLSGSTCSNRPHMSKDTRWGAINAIRKQYGFLGLSHFNLLKKLGSGDIGTVYLAELIGTNCAFAIKVMDNEFLGRRKKMPRAQTEREILRMLDHPFLPTLYAQFTSDNLSCLVMEFCPGGDLHVLRQKQPGRYFPEEAARFYVAEVLLALEYLHMLGIIYRDLKPENILVREDGHIMLTDFDLSLRCSVNPTLVKSSSLGLDPPRISGPCAGSNCIDPFCSAPSCQVSCFTPRLLPAAARARKLKADALAKARSLPQLVVEPTEARSNSFVGTHEYLAPEIIKGEGHGSAVDWWTFGVLLYELLYGKTPFKGSENEETLANVVCQSLKFPDSPIVSFQARDLIRGLLVKVPENRLGMETGAAEIKRHPFFEGLNWALIRCAVPPQIPEFYDVGSLEVDCNKEKGKRFVEYGANGEQHLEFELF